MFAIFLFWLAMIFPGYAAARLVDDSDNESGLLGMIGLSYFWTFALLSPVSIACYVLHLPVAVFSVACVLLATAGLVVIVQRKWWPAVGRLVVGGLGIELALVVADLVCAGRVGTFMSGDAEIHLARIRYILAHGFSNHSPFMNCESFFALYHTNLLHAVHAACTQLTQTDYLDAWSANLVWSKLVIAGGFYYAAWAVLRSRWAAWPTMLFLYFFNAPLTYLTCPSKPVPLWLCSIAIGIAVHALREPIRWPIPVKLAVLSLVMGQIHGLFPVLCCVIMAPMLGGALALRLLRRRGARRMLALSLVALFVGVPFALVARYGGTRPPPDPTIKRTQTPTVQKANARFHEWEGGLIALKFSRYYGGHGAMRLSLFAAGIVGLVLLGRRREAFGLGAIVAVVLAAFFFPWWCTWLAKQLGGRWVLLRVSQLADTTMAITMWGAAGLALKRFLPRWWLRAALALVAAGLAIWLTYDRASYSWKEYWQKAREPSEKRNRWLDVLHAQQDFYAEHIPPGSVVLAHPRAGRTLVMLRDCYIVTPDRSGDVGPTIYERRHDQDTLLDPQTPWAQRKALIQQYGIDRLLVSGQLSNKLGWLQGHMRGTLKGPGTMIVLLDLQ